MKKSKDNFKRIILIIAALLIAYAGAVYGVNTEELKGFTGFTGVGQQDLKPIKPDTLTVDTTLLRYEAARDTVNYSPVDEVCNTGVWKKTGRFILNTEQSIESTVKLRDKMSYMINKGCDIRMNISTLGSRMTDSNKTPFPGHMKQRYNCNYLYHNNLSLGNMRCGVQHEDNLVTLDFDLELNDNASFIRAKLNAENSQANNYLTSDEEKLLEIFTR